MKFAKIFEKMARRKPPVETTVDAMGAFLNSYTQNDTKTWASLRSVAPQTYAVFQQLVDLLPNGQIITYAGSDITRFEFEHSGLSRNADQRLTVTVKDGQLAMNSKNISDSEAANKLLLSAKRQCLINVEVDTVLSLDGSPRPKIVPGYLAKAADAKPETPEASDPSNPLLAIAPP